MVVLRLLVKKEQEVADRFKARRDDIYHM